MTERDYNECVRMHADNLYRFVLKNTRSREDAKDIVQSSFEKMWTRRDGVNAATCKAFLFTVAYHEVVDFSRRKKRKLEADEEVCYHRLGADHKKILQIAFSKLNNLQRSLVLLKDWEGYSYEEISGITGLNTSQVKVYLHRARLQLRKFLGSLENVV